MLAYSNSLMNEVTRKPQVRHFTHLHNYQNDSFYVTRYIYLRVMNVQLTLLITDIIFYIPIPQSRAGPPLRVRNRPRESHLPEKARAPRRITRLQNAEVL